MSFFCGIAVFRTPQCPPLQALGYYQQKNSIYVFKCMSEAFQGVTATSDMTLKTSDTGVSKQRQATRICR